MSDNAFSGELPQTIPGLLSKSPRGMGVAYVETDPEIVTGSARFDNNALVGGIPPAFAAAEGLSEFFTFGCVVNWPSFLSYCV